MHYIFKLLHVQRSQSYNFKNCGLLRNRIFPPFDASFRGIHHRSWQDTQLEARLPQVSLIRPTRTKLTGCNFRSTLMSGNQILARHPETPERVIALVYLHACLPSYLFVCLKSHAVWGRTTRFQKQKYEDGDHNDAFYMVTTTLLAGWQTDSYEIDKEVVTQASDVSRHMDK